MSTAALPFLDPGAQIEYGRDGQQVRGSPTTTPVVEQVDAEHSAGAPDERLRRQRTRAACELVGSWGFDPAGIPERCPGVNRALWGKSGKPADPWERFDARRNWSDRGDKIASMCGTGFEQVPVYRCGYCGHVWHAAPRGCGLRYCPTCVKWIRARMVKKATKIIGTFRRPRFCTLTIRNQPDLQAMLELLVASWQRLRWRKVWRTRADGCAWALEVTGSPERGWHAHLHVIWDGLFIPRDELANAWEQVTHGAGRYVWLTQCRGGPQAAAREMAKYVGKDIGWGKGFAGDAEMLAEFMACMWGFKAFRVYGSARKIKQDAEPMFACPQCKMPWPIYLGSIQLKDAGRWIAELVHGPPAERMFAS